ncbi:MAG TPA: BatA domain-containing protein [Myxococcales bacterium LLY-WYZ-16_1]|nr:BatA domain-containing protein [Myxococcales bacterium LLY-WYZ-16_1]
MSFAQPWMLWGIAAAALPVLIHLLFRRQPRRQPFPAMELLMQSIRRVERSWRLLRWLLLAARVAVLAAFALAASRPFFSSETAAASQVAGPERLALVVDRSLSMRATYDGRSAFDVARELADRAAGRMEAEDVAVLVWAGPEPELAVAPPTGNPATLSRALRDGRPGFEGADLGRAVTVAARALAPPEDRNEGPADEGVADEPVRRVVVFSDLARNAIRSPADPGGARIEWVRVPSADTDRSNRALVSVRAEPAPNAAPHTLRFVARARSFAESDDRPEPETVPIDLTGQGDAQTRTFIDLPAGAVVEKTMDATFGGAGTYRVNLRTPPDRLAEDDRYALMARVRPRVRLLVVDGAPSGVPNQDEVFYLERALRTGSDDQPAPRIVPADDFAAATLSEFDVVWLAGVTRLSPEDGQRLTRFVRGGGGLAISAAEGLGAESYNQALADVLPRPFRGLKRFGEPWAGSTGALSFASPDLDHPVLSLFRGEAASGLLSSRSTGILLTEPVDRGRVLLRHEGGQPALLAHEPGRGRVLVLTTSVDRDLSDFAIRPAFVPWVRRTLLWLGRALYTPDRRMSQVGEPRPLKVPPDTERIRVEGPDGAATELSPGQAFVPRRPGHHRVQVDRGAGPVRWPEEDFAAHLDPAESDLRPLPDAEVQRLLRGSDEAGIRAGPSAEFAAAGGWDGRTLVSALLLALLLALLFESLLTLRRT